MAEERQPTAELEANATKFEEEEPTRMIEDGTVMDRVRPMLAKTRDKRQNVSLAQVSTYIYQTEMSKTIGNKRIIFPTFASHWTVIVSDTEHSNVDLGYHLTFEEEAAAMSSPPANTSRRVIFSSMLLEQVPEGAKLVGTTPYDHQERMRIGKAMIEGFGTYHRVFWNCQHFARLYLSAITEGKGAFDEWTSGLTSNLFLCAFLITIPIAAMNKSMEIRKTEDILKGLCEGEEVDQGRVLKASDQAITLARNMAIEDYRRNEASRVKMEGPRRGRGFIAQALDWLRRVVQ
jgi:hypothetical protein